ncbi:MAG TPA: serine hydroxymethyltransferase [Gammaproteobacteria bacterium]|nr:serine hydroxymethyltransferase [Gammaproteobacteria bacterium]
MSSSSGRHFITGIAGTDPTLAQVLENESRRQQDQIELIASENLVSRAVLDALGSHLTNKTVEGYPGKRFHGGAEFVDVAERLAIERACELFGARFANVQPHSGTQANQAVFLALLQPGDTILSLSLSAGGHLSHGAPPNLSGKWFDVVHYGVRSESCLIDYSEAERLAAERRPKLVITGGSAYPREIDFERFRRIADRAGARMLVDMAHFAGLVAAGVHPSPVGLADVVTCTTTKTLRGPRGGVILCNDEVLAKRIDSAVFPGMQGSVHLSTVAAKAVCLGEALKPSFRDYAKQVVGNARSLASALVSSGIDVVTGGTDTHLVLLDLRSSGVTGIEAEKSLAAVNITCNKNPIPFDPPPPSKWSGLRLGVSAGTTRGFGNREFAEIGAVIAGRLAGALSEEAGRKRVAALCRRFPVYAHDPPGDAD